MSDNEFKDLPQSEIEFESLQNYGRNAWMVRPCLWYKQEYNDCKSIKDRIHQLFIYGEPIDCSHWKQDYDNCMQFRSTKRTDFLDKVLASEYERKRKRLQASLENDTWSYRKEAPKEWSKPLPQWFTEQTRNSFLTKERSLHSSINSNLINVCVNNTTNCWPVCHNRFKLLIHLQHDINKVRIWIESNNKTVLAEVNLTLYYKPLLNKKYIKIVYLLCEDEFGDLFDFGRFQAPLDEDNSISSAMKRLSLNMLIIQCFIAQTLPVHKTFNLELDQNNFPNVNLFKLKLANKQIGCLEPNQLWEYVAQQLMCSQLANQDYKYIAFCSFTRYSSDTHECTSNLCDINTNGLAHISLGGGGLALLGSACLHMWPENINQIVDRFNNQSLIDNNVISQNDCAKRFIWGCYSTTLGACIHEIGHILDLGHSSTHGIMATDFNNIHTFFTIKSFNSTEIKWWLSSEINILSHHKWINDAVIEDSANDVLYKSNNIIKSKYGIVVIEYRDPINNTIIFNELFTLPAKIVKIKQINKHCEMFAIDIYGNIIKLLLN